MIMCVLMYAETNMKGARATAYSNLKRTTGLSPFPCLNMSKNKNPD